MGTFAAGHARECITPPPGTHMMGYAGRTDGCRGVHDDLFVNAVALRAEGETVALLAYDLCFLDLPLVRDIRSAVRDATGLDAARVLLNCSHTHAGPAVGEWAGQARHADYERLLVKQSAAVTFRAVEDARPSSFWVGAAPLDIGCNRRELRPDGTVTLGVNRAGARLPEATVWQFARAEAPDIILFSTPMHGTVLGGENLLISAEWSGAAARHFEERRPQARAVFLQGCGADQNPYRDRGGFDQMDEHGQAAAVAMEHALGTMRRLQPAPVRCLAKDVPVPLLGDERRPSGRWRSTWPLPLHAVRIGEAILAGLGCEPFVEYALFARRVSPAAETLLLGYTDGSVGYLPTADAYAAGGYEPMANQYFPVGRPFVPQSEEMVKAELRTAFDALWAGETPRG